MYERIRKENENQGIALEILTGDMGIHTYGVGFDLYFIGRRESREAQKGSF